MKYLKKSVLFILLLLFGLCIEVLYSNYSLKVVTQQVVIPNLPKAFDGFTILQLADLHSAGFGEKQSRLLGKIATIDYDMVAFTGDYVVNPSYDVEKDLQPFYALIQGLKKDVPKYYIGGNVDQPAFEVGLGKVTAYGDALQQMGVTLLNGVHTITKGQEKVYIVPFQGEKVAQTYLTGDIQMPFMSFELDEMREYGALSEKEKGYYQALFNQFEQLKESDTVIALGHYPDHESFYVNTDFKQSTLYDVVLAGHYHGGQVVIPGYGPFFVPDERLPGAGWFPKREEVSGLRQVGNYQQYISKGLGASKSTVMKWRFFNPPEIDVITLVRGD